jgi:hypothetical protein
VELFQKFEFMNPEELATVEYVMMKYPGTKPEPETRCLY